MTGLAYLGFPQPTLHRDAPRKGGVNIGFCNQIWLTYRCWRITFFCGRTKNDMNVPLILDAWNIRTLQDKINNKRPERRTALVCKELARFNIDVAALSDTRLAEEGNLRESGSQYTIFWKRKGAEQQRIHGGGFTIRSQFVDQHNLFPVSMSDRIITLRLPLLDKNFLTIISVYAPTLTSADEHKASFYSPLYRPDRSKIRQACCVGDFNARVGKDHQLWKGKRECFCLPLHHFSNPCNFFISAWNSPKFGINLS